MRSSDPLYPIKHLIGEPGFSSNDDLGSFCLSVGLFHDRRIKTEVKTPKTWNPWHFRTWPMLEVIAYNKGPSLKDRSEIRDLLYQYYLGGVNIIVKKVSNKTQISALKDLSEFIPP